MAVSVNVMDCHKHHETLESYIHLYLFVSSSSYSWIKVSLHERQPKLSSGDIVMSSHKIKLDTGEGLRLIYRSQYILKSSF
uniref:Uncharacterized protein n=1 Tax=Octopus bimaculoides TaxID=37653 RepID=A0A0L8HK02_OCTBM